MSGPGAAAPPLAIDLEVPLGRFTLSVRWAPSAPALGVFGHSGAGKTTLLEAMAGLRKGARGAIRVNGRAWLDTPAGVCLPPDQRGVGYVPQDALLFPHRDVMGNVLAGRRRAAASGRRLDPERVMAVLELDGLRGRPIGSLSGGEKQRVALARALCSGPEMLLLDEPLASLDLPLRRRILPYLVRVQDAFGIPTLYVSHDATEVRVLSAEALVLEQGRAVMTGPTDAVITDRAVLPMARAEGFENVLRGRVEGLEERVATIAIAPGVAIRVPAHGLAGAREAIVSLRAEDLILAVRPPQGLSAQNILPGVVREIRGPEAGEEADGPVLALVDPGGPAPAGTPPQGGAPVVVALTLRACRQLALAPGAPVHIIFKTQACRLLAARGVPDYNRAFHGRR